MKKNLIVLAAFVAVIPFGAICADWNFSESHFNQDGDVTLNMESGEIRTVNNNKSMYSTSTSPTVVNVQQSTNGAFPFSNDGIRKSVNFDPDGYTAGAYTMQFDDLCVIGKLKAYASAKLGYNTYFHSVDLTVIYENKRHNGLYSVGQWSTSGTTKTFDSDGKYYIPAGATLEMKVNGSCSRSAGHWCSVNFSVSCLPSTF